MKFRFILWASVLFMGATRISAQTASPWTDRAQTTIWRAAREEKVTVIVGEGIKLRIEQEGRVKELSGPVSRQINPGEVRWVGANEKAGAGHETEVWVSTWEVVYGSRGQARLHEGDMLLAQAGPDLTKGADLKELEEVLVALLDTTLNETQMLGLAHRAGLAHRRVTAAKGWLLGTALEEEVAGRMLSRHLNKTERRQIKMAIDGILAQVPDENFLADWHHGLVAGPGLMNEAKTFEDPEVLARYYFEALARPVEPLTGLRLNSLLSQEERREFLDKVGQDRSMSEAVKATNTFLGENWPNRRVGAVGLDSVVALGKFGGGQLYTGYYTQIDWRSVQRQRREWIKSWREGEAGAEARARMLDTLPRRTGWAAVVVVPEPGKGWRARVNPLSGLNLQGLVQQMGQSSDEEELTRLMGAIDKIYHDAPSVITDEIWEVHFEIKKKLFKQWPGRLALDKTARPWKPGALEYLRKTSGASLTVHLGLSNHR